MELDPIIYLRSDLHQGCSCGLARAFDGDDLGSFASHFITEHGYRLSHSGQETGRDSEGNLWQTTVIVLTNQ